MKAVFIGAGILLAAFFLWALVYGISAYVLGLAIKRKGSFARATGKQDVLGGSWEKYQEKIKAGKAWYENQPFEEVEISSFDGLRLRGRLYFQKQQAKGERPMLSGVQMDKVIIMAHGYRGSAQDLAFPSSLLFQQGYNILLMSQRSHGNSEGAYICFGQLECRDMKGWIDFIVKRLTEKGQIFLYGVSMGATTAMMTAGLDLPPQVKGIIADCGFTGFGGMARHMLRKSFHLPLWPFYPLADKIFQKKTSCNFSASTTDALKNSKLPILFIHGMEDHFVLPAMSQMNYQASAAADRDKKLYFVEGAAHGKAIYEDTQGTLQEIKSFLQRCEES